MTDTRYVDFFLSAPADVRQLELIEVSHPSFSKTYRIVRNERAGVTVNIPGLGATAFEFRPLKITRGGQSDDLSQEITIDLGDVGAVLPEELDRVVAADATGTRPKLRYWAYRSDDLTLPLVGPLTYEVRSYSASEEGGSLHAAAQELNATTTGELYTIDRFPMLRGFL